MIETVKESSSIDMSYGAFGAERVMRDSIMIITMCNNWITRHKTIAIPIVKSETKAFIRIILILQSREGCI